MATGNRAGSEAFAGLILKGVKETGEEFGVGAYGRVFAVDYYGTVCAAKEVHSILIFRELGITFYENVNNVQNYVIQTSFSF